MFYIAPENDYEEMRRQNILRNNNRYAATLGITQARCMAEAKIRSLQKDLDMATRENTELYRGWNSTIEDCLEAAADLQKLVTDNFVPNSADADVHGTNKGILEQVKARAEIMRLSLRVDIFKRVIQKEPNE